RGNMAPSSAYVSAPMRVSAPPTTHARATSHGEPAPAATRLTPRKMPEPMTMPTIIDAAPERLSSRRSPAGRSAPDGAGSGRATARAYIHKASPLRKRTIHLVKKAKAPAIMRKNVAKPAPQLPQPVRPEPPQECPPEPNRPKKLPDPWKLDPPQDPLLPV